MLNRSIVTFYCSSATCFGISLTVSIVFTPGYLEPRNCHSMISRDRYFPVMKIADKITIARDHRVAITRLEIARRKDDGDS